MRIISYIFLLLIILLGISFAILNADPVSLNYYVGTRKISLSLLLVLSVGIGVLLGLLVTVIPLLKLKKANHDLKGQLKRTEKELSQRISPVPNLLNNH